MSAPHWLNVAWNLALGFVVVWVIWYVLGATGYRRR
jgi:hypothetical protein